MISFYRNFIRKGDLCFDIGGNQGERTDCFLKSGGNVVTVEPQNSCVNLLTEKYRNSARVNVIQAVLGPSESEVLLRICDESDECSTLSEEFIHTYTGISGLHWRKTEKVKMLTLDNLILQYGMPVFCKLDVEGYESEVFKGLSRPLPVICFEFNYPILQDSIRALEILYTLDNSYVCNFFHYEEMELRMKEWMPVRNFIQQIRTLIPATVLTGEIIVKSKGWKT
ncbi:MAG: FkbM family methyltransferase [Bacteroidia bacterium]|nr:FkbM family methyltransferase [Bacteroidia bacterium]